MAKISKREVYQFECIEGGSFVLRLITENLRMKLREANLALLERFNKLNTEEDVILGKPEAERDAQRLRDITAETNAIMIQLDQHWYEAVVIEVLNIESENDAGETVVVNKENFQSYAPAAAYGEIVSKIKERTSLGGAAVKN